MYEEISALERRDINKQVDRLLRDLGDPEPPLSLEDVRRQLNVDRHYYSMSDPSLLNEMAHKLKVGRNTITEAFTSLFEAARKAKLCAFWIPDKRRILIDQDVPEKKHRWIEAHEVGHSITPWHETYLFGDSEQTLDPACHAAIEAEANYAAGQLLFLRKRFGEEARESELNFKSIQRLSKTFGNSLTSTLWRIVEEREATRPVFGLVSCHPRYPQIGKADDGGDVRHFVRSAAFRERFGHITPDDAFSILQVHSAWTKRGKLFETDHPIVDANGCLSEFHIECLATPYYVLTYGMYIKACPIVR